MLELLYGTGMFIVAFCFFGAISPIPEKEED